MKKLVQVVVFLVLITPSFLNVKAQKYMTKTGYAYFMSHTDAIDIDGHNRQTAAIADPATGELVVIVLIKSFEFSLATADKHFNETYMESDKYPKAVFKGIIPELKELDLSKDGEYEVEASGNLTIHGVTKPIAQKGTLKVKGGEIHLASVFAVSIDDYEIQVPKSVEDRVAKQVDVKIELNLLKQ